MTPVLAKSVVDGGLLSRREGGLIPELQESAQVGPGREGPSCQLTFTVRHVREPPNQRADPWHHLVVLMQGLHAVHCEQRVLLGQAVQQQDCVPQTPHCPPLLLGPGGPPFPPHCQPLSM